MQVEFNINGELRRFEIKPQETLLALLRKEGYWGVKQGCSDGSCGGCAVLVDGKIRNSCVMFAAQAHQRKIMTIEGLGSKDNLHPLQKSFLEMGAVQCGFCTPGAILAAKSLLDQNSFPTEEEIKEALDGNLCRCTGYVKMIEAVKRVTKK